MALLRLRIGALLALVVLGCPPSSQTPGDGRAPVVDVAGRDGGSWRSIDGGGAPSPDGRDGPAGVPSITWQGSESVARRTAREQARPLVIYLRADWVAASAEVERSVWTDPRVRRAMQPAVACRLDLSGADPSHDHQLAALKVHRLPAVLLLDGRGEELGRLEGPMAAAAVLELLEAIAR